MITNEFENIHEITFYIAILIAVVRYEMT